MTERLSNTWETGCPTGPLCPLPHIHRAAWCRTRRTHGSVTARALGKLANTAAPQTADEQRGEALGVQRGTRLLLCGAGKVLCPGNPAPPQHPPRRTAPSPAVGPRSCLCPGEAAVGPLPALKTTDHTDTHDSASAFLCLRVKSVLRQESILFFFLKKRSMHYKTRET